MATTIRATCEVCGSIDLPLREAHVQVPFTAGEGATVTFSCPHCSHTGLLELSERATMLLLRAGVDVTAGGSSLRDFTVASPQPDQRR